MQGGRRQSLSNLNAETRPLQISIRSTFLPLFHPPHPQQTAHCVNISSDEIHPTTCADSTSGHPSTFLGAQESADRLNDVLVRGAGITYDTTGTMSATSPTLAAAGVALIIG
jgi:hypothetical protein